MFKYVDIFLSSFLVVLFLTPLVRWVAFRIKALDHPSQRKVHRTPTPLLGGVPIYLAFVFAVLSTMDFNEPLKGILVGGTIIFFMGLIDDLFHLPAWVKLIGQIFSAGLLISYGIIFKIIPNLYVSAAITILWVVGFTNALNFLDNMDGLAAGLASISSFLFASIAYQSGQRFLAYLTVALGASTLSFLIYNFKPAKIFMGDAGSTFLGFNLAAFAVMGDWSFHPFVAATIPLFILGVLLFDITLITILRIKDGKVRSFRQWIEHADTDHFSHRLVGLGLTQRQAVLFIYFVNFSLGIWAIALWKADNTPLSIWAWGCMLTVAFIGGKRLDKAKIKRR